MTAQPQGAVVLPGTTVSLAASAAGSGPLVYQWQCAGTNLTDDGRITGSQTGNLSIRDAQISDSGNYQIIVTNSYGATTSAVATVTITTNYALSFNGQGGCEVTIPANGSVTGTFTVECWVNPAVSGGVLGVIGSRQQGGASFDFKLESDVHGDIGNGSSWLTTSADAPLNYQPGSWHHIAYVVTPTNYTIYTDGDLAGSGTYGPDDPVLYDADHHLLIGDTGAGEMMDGQIDEVRIWSIARSQADILASMNTELAGTEAGLSGYWRFDEGSGTTTADSSGNSLTGTLNGGVVWVLSGAPIAAFVSPPVPPSFQPITIGAGVVNLSWNAVAGQNYQVQFCPDLTQPAWTNLGQIMRATNSIMSVTDTVGSAPQRFYRVVLSP